jgi:hypothetical protein
MKTRLTLEKIERPDPHQLMAALSKKVIHSLAENLLRNYMLLCPIMYVTLIFSDFSYHCSFLATM